MEKLLEELIKISDAIKSDDLGTTVSRKKWTLRGYQVEHIGTHQMSSKVSTNIEPILSITKENEGKCWDAARGFYDKP